MSALDREGRFQAYIVKHALKEIGQNGLTAFTAEYAVATEQQPDGSWADVSGEQLTIAGVHFLEKLDGQLNLSTIDQIKRAIPQWDGVDLLALDDADLAQVCVQITVAMDTWQGKTRPKVQWLASFDDEGMAGLTEKDPVKAREIANRLGSRLRAEAGGTQVKGSAPQGRPVPPGPPTKTLNEMAREAKAATKAGIPGAPPPPGPPTAKAATRTPRSRKPPAPPKPPTVGAAITPYDAMMAAWNVFLPLCPEEWTTLNREEEFFRIVSEMFEGRDLSKPEALTIQEWGKVQAEAGGKILPFDQAQQKGA